MLSFGLLFKQFWIPHEKTEPKLTSLPMFPSHEQVWHFFSPLIWSDGLVAAPLTMSVSPGGKTPETQSQHDWSKVPYPAVQCKTVQCTLVLLIKLSWISEMFNYLAYLSMFLLEQQPKTWHEIIFSSFEWTSFAFPGRHICISTDLRYFLPSSLNIPGAASSLSFHPYTAVYF